MGGQYGPYVMYFLSQLLQKRQDEEKQQNRKSQENIKERDDVDTNVFSADEAEASWHREENIELLKQFCREGYAQAKKHGHFIVGTGSNGDFIGIPGRFLIEEQPAGEQPDSLSGSRLQEEKSFTRTLKK